MPGLQGLLVVGPAHRLQGPLVAAPDLEIRQGAGLTGLPFSFAFPPAGLCLSYAMQSLIALRSFIHAHKETLIEAGLCFLFWGFVFLFIFLSLLFA